MENQKSNFAEKENPTFNAVIGNKLCQLYTNKLIVGDTIIPLKEVSQVSLKYERTKWWIWVLSTSLLSFCGSFYCSINERLTEGIIPLSVLGGLLLLVAVLLFCLSLQYRLVIVSKSGVANEVHDKQGEAIKAFHQNIVAVID